MTFLVLHQSNLPMERRLCLPFQGFTQTVGITTRAENAKELPFLDCWKLSPGSCWKKDKDGPLMGRDTVPTGSLSASFVWHEQPTSASRMYGHVGSETEVRMDPPHHLRCSRSWSTRHSWSRQAAKHFQLNNQVTRIAVFTGRSD